MDTAVALVRSYLHMNGYFSVTEYPVLELLDDGEVRTVTDVDVLAVRFPGAGRNQDGPFNRRIIDIDPAIDVDRRQIDLIIGEVKEGRAELNHAARDRGVLHAALHRFGWVDEATAAGLIDQLLDSGEANHPAGIRVRLMSFGSRPPKNNRASHRWLLMGQMVSYMHRVISENWAAARTLQSKDPVLALMILQEKALRGEA